MRIDRVRVEHFGGLKHFDTGKDPLGNLVVVFGPNESGKTTFFNFTRSMMYGFSPAARATNPYTPWSGADIEGHIDGYLDSGDRFAVRRRLRSSPWGRLQLPGEEIELRNRAVPFAEHVPAAVYRKLFALTLDELSTLDRGTWGALQDRLLAAMVLDDLLPAKQVAETLQADARALWRPDNRGQPQDRKITAMIKDLQGKRRHAADKDAELRRNQQDLKAASVEHAAVRERRDELASVVRGLEIVVPANRRLRRLREARELSEQAHAVHDLPDGPIELLGRLESELGRFQRDARRLEARRAALLKEVASYDAHAQGLVALSETLRIHETAFEKTPIVAAAVEAKREEVDATTARLHELMESLFQPGVTLEQALAALSAVPMDDLDEAVILASRPVELSDETSPTDDVAVPDRPLPSSLIPALVAMVLGVVLLIAASSTEGVLLAAFGGALLLFAMGAFVLAWDRKRRNPNEDHAAVLAAAHLRRASERMQRVARARELLESLPLQAELLAEPPPTLVSTLREVSVLALDRESRAQALAKREAELDRLAQVTRPLFEAAGHNEDDGALELFRSLDAAERRAQTSVRAQEELESVEAELVELVAEQTGTRSTRDGIQTRLSEVGGGSVERGAEVLSQWRKAERRTDELEREFRRDLGEPDDIAGEVIAFRGAHQEWPVEAASVDAARLELEEVARRCEVESGRVQRLEGEGRFLDGGTTTTEIDGQVAALMDERTRLRRERDRLELLGSIVEEAERRFREHHQPDVLERSAEYLAAITDGRYRRLLPAHEGKDGVLSLETSEGRPVGLGEALSRGTKEQVLLSLRLAAADHMDRSGERLPLFVDEVFVNWDRSRRDRGLELLRQLSRKRQVFVFTCHADVAERLASLGSRIFKLPSA